MKISQSELTIAKNSTSVSNFLDNRSKWQKSNNELLLEKIIQDLDNLIQEQESKDHPFFCIKTLMQAYEIAVSQYNEYMSDDLTTSL